MTTLHYFLAEILSPVTGEPIAVEVSYSIRDCGVLPSHREYRAIVSSALDIVGAELLPHLDADSIGRLERQAFEDWQDDCTLSLFGSGDV